MRAAISRNPRAALVAAVAGALLASAAFAAVARSSPGYAPHPEQFTGNLVNTVGSARWTQPFTVEIDRYTSGDELHRMVGTLESKGQFNLRDQLWHKTVGNFSVGGRIGYPIAAVLTQDTPDGRMIRLLVDRPIAELEVLHPTHTERYPFSMIELHIDRNGRGQGVFVAAARLEARDDQLAFESYGVQPLRLLNVRED